MLRPLLLLLCILSLSVATAADPVIHDTVDENPQPRLTPPPAYPPELLSRNVSGLVLLEVVIDDTGRVDRAEIIKSTENAFNAPSLEAVKSWRFRAAKIAGQDVWVRIKLPLKFAPET